MLSILNGTSPLFALIIAITWFRQNTTLMQILGLGLGFLGLMVFIGTDQISFIFYPVLLCLIGASSVLIPGITVNSNAIIGAGSTVVKDVKKNSTFYGS